MFSLGEDSPNEFEYIEVKDRPPPYDYNFLTPIVRCPNCEERFMEDHTRDAQGCERPLDPSDPIDEILLRAKCTECQEREFNEALASDTMRTIEQRLGLTEENKKTLEALMHIVDNPERIVIAIKLHDRVDEFERRLEDRIVGLRGEMETKLDNANSRVQNVSIIKDISLAVNGVLVGVIATLLLGG